MLFRRLQGLPGGAIDAMALTDDLRADAGLGFQNSRGPPTKYLKGCCVHELHKRALRTHHRAKDWNEAEPIIRDHYYEWRSSANLRYQWHLALGAVRVRLLPADGADESCLVMQGIEGNEFCLD